ncbi:unnamed protein product, partial [Peniophora sp. CBMAI 1063]
LEGPSRFVNPSTGTVVTRKEALEILLKFACLYSDLQCIEQENWDAQGCLEKSYLRHSEAILVLLIEEWAEREIEAVEGAFGVEAVGDPDDAWALLDYDVNVQHNNVLPEPDVALAGPRGRGVASSSRVAFAENDTLHTAGSLAPADTDDAMPDVESQPAPAAHVRHRTNCEHAPPDPVYLKAAQAMELDE